MKRSSFNENWIYKGEKITLPHDAMIHEQRDTQAPCGSAGAFYPGGKFTYEKKFPRPEAPHALLQFEGVYRDAKVYVNGQAAGGAAYGYIPFFVNLDPFLQEGENEVRVECEVEQPDSRWYSGAGIYRPVWLWTGPADSIEPESVRISTLSYAPAVIRVQSPKAVKISVYDPEDPKGERINGGQIVAEGSGTDFELTIPDAKLWSEDSPSLYRAVAARMTQTDETCAAEEAGSPAVGEKDDDTVQDTGAVRSQADSEEIRFGIRKVEWSSQGLFVNGKQTLLRGGAVHHDQGVIGAAAYDESEYRRVKILKESGFNAVRSAHNPASRAMLEACDALGMYVMDETWDMWFYHKTVHDYASEWREHYLEDIDAMISRDFNHPSVILYSVGNEVSEPAGPEGVDVLRTMVNHIHETDANRAVTGGFNLMILSKAAQGKGIYDENGGRKDQGGEKAVQGMNSTMFNLITSMIGPGMNKAANGSKADRAASPALDLLDICGYNYASGRYAADGRLHPDRVIFGSETFPYTLSQNWAMVKKYPYLIGDFMWTAWDYLGEAGIGAWAYTEDGKGFEKPYPWLLADTGALDILGNPNGEMFWAKAVWGLGTFMAVQPMNHDRKPAKAAWRGTNALPSWSWKGCEGRKAAVEVYTAGTRVKLFLNGKQVGSQRVKNNRAVFKVKYAPGKLKAIVLDETGKMLAQTELSSAGPAGVTVCSEKTEVRPGEIVYVPIRMADRSGTVESNADTEVRVTVENGELLGFGSANPRTEERFDAGTYTTYYGQALAVIRAGKSGTVHVHAEGGGQTAEAVIVINK